ncbi:universal stress protein [Halobacteriaceae archaeon GCM10025711]
MYQNILVPTDGSSLAEEAAEHGIDLAKNYDATLHVLYVVDMGEIGFTAIPDDIVETKDLLRGRGEEAVQRIVEMAGDAGVETVTKVDSGVPSDTIIEYLDEHDVDLVVMGSRGRSDLSNIVIGSTADRVIRRTDIPVQTIG